MATFLPQLLDPENPDSVAAWARAVSDWANGQVSIGEPVAPNPDPLVGGVDPIRPNGVKGHLLGSFVTVTQTAQAQVIRCTHNLGVVPKGLTLPGILHTDPLNVAWVVVRVRHDNTLLAGPPAGGPSLPVFVGGAGSVDTTDGNYIDLAFRVDGYDIPATSMVWELWFFPTTL